MPLLKWKPEYTVNESKLDCHHIKLFEILNAAYEDVMNSSEEQSVGTIVSELADYLAYHFAAEEQYMKDNGYEQIDAHIAEHRAFADRIETLKVNHHDNNLEAAKELIIILGNWVLHHILIEDRKYAALISQEGHNKQS